MKKGDVFEFIAPNGSNVKAVVLDIISSSEIPPVGWSMEYLCYGQNRLFTVTNEVYDGPSADEEISEDDWFTGFGGETGITFGHVVYDYVVIPHIDEKLRGE